MTKEEAIQILKILKEDYWDDDGYGHETKEYDDTMLALDKAIEALEQEPAQVELEGDGYADGELVYDFGKCPNCGWEFEEGDKDWEQPYCCHCGQKLYWFEEQEVE